MTYCLLVEDPAPVLSENMQTILNWKKICFLTNGSDNGGSTYNIVKALRPDYEPTLPVGDISSALIGLLAHPKYDLLNLRSWKLDPEYFTPNEVRNFADEIRDETTFTSRLKLAIHWYRNKSRVRVQAHDSEGDDFYENLTRMGQLVDEVGLIRQGVKGLDLSESSVRHHLFNAAMIRAGAYDKTRKTVEPDNFSVGLYLLQKILGIGYAVFPSSIDEQVLFAEWIDENGKTIWSTKNKSPAVSGSRCWRPGSVK